VASTARFAPIAALLREAVDRRVFPCATIEVGTSDGVHLHDACGTLTYESAAPAATIDTVFDLASLTKVIATTTVVMQLLDQGQLRLEDPVRRWIDDWRRDDRHEVTLADLLEHTSGLTAHLSLFRDHTGRADFQHTISTLPLFHPAWLPGHGRGRRGRSRPAIQRRRRASATRPPSVSAAGGLARTHGTDRDRTVARTDAPGRGA